MYYAFAEEFMQVAVNLAAACTDKFEIFEWVLARELEVGKPDIIIRSSVLHCETYEEPPIPYDIEE